MLLVLALAAALATACDDPDTARGVSQPATHPPPSAQTGPPSQQSSSTEAAPQFSITTFEGDTFSLAEHRGTPVVLVFWESW